MCKRLEKCFSLSFKQFSCLFLCKVNNSVSSASRSSFDAFTRFSVLTLSLPGRHLKTTNKSVKFEILLTFVFFSALTSKRTCIKRNNIESGLLQDGKYTLLAGMSAIFSAEILQTGAVKGLMR